MERRDLKILAEWEATLRAESESLRSERSRIEADLQRVSKKLELVRQMLSLEHSPNPSTPQSDLTEGKATPSGVKEMTSKILAESGSPMHISEIHRKFVERGYPIPGQGTAFNILAHLVNDKTFVRVARGTYALAGTVPDDQILPKAARTRRRGARRRKKSVRPRTDQEIR